MGQYAGIINQLSSRRTNNDIAVVKWNFCLSFGVLVRVGPSTRPSTKSKRRARKHAAMSQKGQEKHKHVPNTLTHKMYPNISAFILSPVLSKTLFARSKTFRSPHFFLVKPRFSTSRRVSSKDAPVAKVKRTRWARARVREIHEYLFREKIDANNTYHHYIRSIVLYINDDFTKRRGRKGASSSYFFSPAKTSFSPCVSFFSIFLSTRQKRQTDKQKSWCFHFFRNKYLLKLIYNTQSKWQVGIDDRLFSSARGGFPGGFVSSVFFVGRYWWNTHTTQQRVDDFYSSFIFVGGSFISSSSSSSLKQCLFVYVALFNKRLL